MSFIRERETKQKMCDVYYEYVDTLQKRISFCLHKFWLSGAPVKMVLEFKGRR